MCKSLKKVVAVRHGDYRGSGGGTLTDLGKSQSEELAKSIASLAQGLSKILLTSPESRAKQTAEIISEKLGGVDSHVCDLFYHDSYSCWKYVLKEVEPLVSEQEVVIIVSHYEMPSGIIRAFRQKHFQRQFACDIIDKGTGIVLCLETGEITFIP